MESTGKDLQRNMQLLEHGIKETIEMRLEVEIATIVVEAARASLDEELAAGMLRRAIVDEEMTAIQRLHNKYPLFDSTVPAPKTLNFKLLEKVLRKRLSINLSKEFPLRHIFKSTVYGGSNSICSHLQAS